jgi:hypothetical protein
MEHRASFRKPPLAAPNPVAIDDALAAGVVRDEVVAAPKLGDDLHVPTAAVDKADLVVAVTTEVPADLTIADAAAIEIIMIAEAEAEARKTETELDVRIDVTIEVTCLRRHPRECRTGQSDGDGRST